MDTNIQPLEKIQRRAYQHNVYDCGSTYYMIRSVLFNICPGLISFGLLARFISLLYSILLSVSAATAALLEEVPIEALQAEIQRRMECAKMPERRTIFIGPREKTTINKKHRGRRNGN